MKKLTNILRGNWKLILGLTVLVGVMALNTGCDFDPYDWLSYGGSGGSGVRRGGWINPGAGPM
ncbi:MAG: hypothetical protein ABII12_17020 [Planctomycetota bacterium]